MWKTIVSMALLATSMGPLSAQVFECQDAQGGTVWTDKPCANGRVLLEGANQAAPPNAAPSDQRQRAQRDKETAAAAERFRQNAYDTAPRASGRNAGSSKNRERCDASRRSLRVESSKMTPNRERLRQLRSDERRFC